MPEISPFQSPYKHWRSGLLLELLATTSFMAILAALAYALAAVI